MRASPSFKVDPDMLRQTEEIEMKSGRNRDEIGTKSGRNRDEIGTKSG